MIKLYTYTNGNNEDFVVYKKEDKNLSVMNPVFITGDVFNWVYDVWMINEYGEVYKTFDFSDTDREKIDFTKFLKHNNK